MLKSTCFNCYGFYLNINNQIPSFVHSKSSLDIGILSFPRNGHTPPPHPPIKSMSLLLDLDEFQLLRILFFSPLCQILKKFYLISIQFINSICILCFGAKFCLKS